MKKKKFFLWLQEFSREKAIGKSKETNHIEETFWLASFAGYFYTLLITKVSTLSVSVK